jgi:hypothetical protein
MFSGRKRRKDECESEKMEEKIHLREKEDRSDGPFEETNP